MTKIELKWWLSELKGFQPMTEWWCEASKMGCVSYPFIMWVFTITPERVLLLQTLKTASHTSPSKQPLWHKTWNIWNKEHGKPSFPVRLASCWWHHHHWGTCKHPDTPVYKKSSHYVLSALLRSAHQMWCLGFRQTLTSSMACSWSNCCCRISRCLCSSSNCLRMYSCQSNAAQSQKIISLSTPCA